MKRLMVSGLVLILATGSAAALADRGHGRDHRGGHGYGYGHRYKHGHHHRHWQPRPYYRNVYYYPYHGYRSDYYPLGAALIGAAVTYSLVHSHNTGYAESRGSAEVIGCHRIERYPDGSERRVEVPIADCY